MNTAVRRIIGSLLGILMLSGCVADIWESYTSPEYGHTRASRICHPYGHCTQGVWEADTQISDDKENALVRCTERTLEQGNSWSQHTVTMGLAVNRCMVDEGYRLVQE